jgi:hypothetical protein
MQPHAHRFRVLCGDDASPDSLAYIIGYPKVYGAD